MLNILAAEGLPLGLNFLEVLIHLFNLAVLMTGMGLLLYKPIKKFMKKRAEEYQKAEEESRKIREEADEMKNEYKSILGGAKHEASQIVQDAVVSAEKQAENIIEDAKKKADFVKKKGESEVNEYIAAQKDALSDSVARLAVSIAANILEREVSPEDNEKLIVSAIEQWKNDEE